MIKSNIKIKLIIIEKVIKVNQNKWIFLKLNKCYFYLTFFNKRNDF